jgi:hypothetical protein
VNHAAKTPANVGENLRFDQALDIAQGRLR